MFSSPEHALTVAFAVVELPIESKNATQLIVEALRERYGMEAPRVPTGLSPHDWHAQAVMVIQFTKRVLADRPDLLRAIMAEYCHNIEGALAIQAVSNDMAADLTGEERLLADLLVMRQFRRLPRMRDLADRFDVSERTLSRRERWWREEVAKLREQAVAALAHPMQSVGLIDAAAA